MNNAYCDIIHLIIPWDPIIFIQMCESVVTLLCEHWYLHIYLDLGKITIISLCPLKKVDTLIQRFDDLTLIQFNRVSTGTESSLSQIVSGMYQTTTDSEEN